MPKTGSKMPYVGVNEIRMYYEEIGDPAAPVLQFSHPWIVVHQALDVLERNSSALTDVSRP